MRLSFLLALLVTLLAALGGARGNDKPNDTLSFERGSWAKLRAEHAHQATVIHFWGLTCGPCIAEMPQWSKLVAERHDLNLVLVAADPFPQPPEEIAARLKRDHLQNVESWAFTDRFYERLRYEIDPQWAGELPRTLMIAPDGRITALEGVADLPKVRAWLDAQTQEKGK